MSCSISSLFTRPFMFEKLTNLNIPSPLRSFFSSFCLFLVFHVLRSGSGSEVQEKSERSFSPSLFPLLSFLPLSLSLIFPPRFPQLPRASSLFLAGQRLMDIHSNEVKAINNSGGNAYPHLVPFLLKSSVCNKRSSRLRKKEKERRVERKERERGKEQVRDVW